MVSLGRVLDVLVYSSGQELGLAAAFAMRLHASTDCQSPYHVDEPCQSNLVPCKRESGQTRSISLFSFNSRSKSGKVRAEMKHASTGTSLDVMIFLDWDQVLMRIYT